MITERTKAILLFTTYLSKVTDQQHKPLSLSEWNKLARWLQSKDTFPEAFLSESSNELLNSWNDQSISKNRLFSLLERKAALAIALDKWTKAGVWIINRADQVYPKILKDKLKAATPNILFGIGNQQLLNQSYIGVIGSRNASEKDLNIAKSIGRQVGQEDLGIVSGAAKGIDEIAMIGVLETEGSCLGFVSDSLIKKSTGLVFRSSIVKNKLVLISHVNPEAGFNAGNAMGRNKLIYAMSEASIVVISDTKGGTWEGAKENLKNNWAPLWVYPSSEKGNQEIVKLGGNWLPNDAHNDFRSLLSLTKNNIKGNDLFTDAVDPSAAIIPLDSINSKPAVKLSEMSNFEFFLYKWQKEFGQAHANEKDLGEKLELSSKQIKIWLELTIKNGFASTVKSEAGNTFVLDVPLHVLPELKD